MVGGTTKITEDIFGSFEVARGGKLVILREETSDDREVRTGGVGEPGEGPKDGLKTSTEGGVWGWSSGDVVNMEAGAVRGGRGIAGGQVKVGKEGLDEGLLGEVDRYIASGRVHSPFVVGPKKPFNGAHEVNPDQGGKRSFKVMFNVIGGGEIDKIVDIHGDVEGWVTRKGGAKKQAGSVRARGEAKLGE